MRDSAGERNRERLGERRLHRRKGGNVVMLRWLLLGLLGGLAVGFLAGLLRRQATRGATSYTSPRAATDATAQAAQNR